MGGPWLLGCIAAVAAIGVVEFYRAFGPVTKVMYALNIISVSAYMILIALFGVSAAFAVTIIFLVAAMAHNVLTHKDRDISRPMVMVFGFIYIAVTLSTVFLVRESAGGIYAVWLIFIAAWGCDTGAYFSGMLFGRRKLAPVLSPKKTVEGAIGGTIIATALGAGFGLVLYNLGEIEANSIIMYATITFICSIAGQFGDLAASAIKRQRGIKDFGNLMPGHGGALDRFDSIIFAAPIAYLMLMLFEAGSVL